MRGGMGQPDGTKCGIAVSTTSWTTVRITCSRMDVNTNDACCALSTNLLHHGHHCHHHHGSQHHHQSHINNNTISIWTSRFAIIVIVDTCRPLPLEITGSKASMIGGCVDDGLSSKYRVEDSREL